MDARKDFPTLKGDSAYLDAAASSLTPEPVIAAVDGFYREMRSSVHRGLFEASEKATTAYEAARADIARFLNADPDEIVFTSGTTHGLNMVAARLGETFSEGDEILISEMEHHAGIVPWQEAAKRHGLTLKWIPVRDDLSLDMDAFGAMLSERTKAVAVVHVSNVTGAVNPVKDISEAAHAVGAAVIVDAAQSAPHLKLDVKALDCDFLAFSGHKTLGPTGVGVLYGKKDRLAAMEPFLYGGHMIRKVAKEGSSWADAPAKFEAGSGNAAGVIGLGAAVRYMDALGMDAVEAHARDLAAKAAGKLSGIDGVTALVPEGGSLGIVSFTARGIHPHDVAEILAREGVSVRAGHHCAMPFMERLSLDGTVRASFHVWNTEADIDRLTEGVKKAKETFDAVRKRFKGTEGSPNLPSTSQLSNHR